MTPLICTLQREHVPAATDVLRDAFYDYPVMRYVIAGGSPDYSDRLGRLIQFFVMARVLRGETVLGVVRGAEITAVALISDPDGPQSPPELDAMREELWAELGADARVRYEKLGSVWQSLALDVPRIHLNMIGVRPALRGGGHGRKLLDEVHELARRTPASTGVSLTTEDPANLGLYAHFGYEVTGHARVDTDMETWALFRSC